jgi:predicted nuclease of predicted toxin-antitoxin system
VKLLLDQNLSRKLVDRLSDAFPDSRHVTAVGLDTSTDQEIWEYAREHGYLIVSKDSDFRQLAFLHGPPPKAVWLRVGNASTSTVLLVLLDHLAVIKEFAVSDDEALLVLPAASID